MMEKLSSHFQTAHDYQQVHQSRYRIPVRCKSIDRILGGGVEQGAITEFYGEFRTGKTQICLQLLLSVTLPEHLGGMGSKAAYIDTEGNFRPERIEQMCAQYDVDPGTILDCIFIATANSTKSQMELIDEVKYLVETHDIKLLVIDSIMANFRTEFTGENRLLERQQLLNQHLNQLAQISAFEVERPIAVVITNQVLTGMLGELVAAGGHIIAHASTHRIKLSRSTKFMGKTPILQAQIIDSPCLPESDANFRITMDGVEDADNTTTQAFKDLLQSIKTGETVG